MQQARLDLIAEELGVRGVAQARFCGAGKVEVFAVVADVELQCGEPFHILHPQIQVGAASLADGGGGQGHCAAVLRSGQRCRAEQHRQAQEQAQDAPAWLENMFHGIRSVSSARWGWCH